MGIQGKLVGIVLVTVLLAGCSGRSGGLFTRNTSNEDVPPGAVSEQVLLQRQNAPPAVREREDAQERGSSGSIWDLFSNRDDPNVTIEVNKYIWAASLDVLSFLPIEAADPFTGVIVTGYGVPPGGGRAYRATIYVQDPALDARSLTLALMTRGGPASRETVRAVEDAILTRARQLRVRDGRL